MKSAAQLALLRIAVVAMLLTSREVRVDAAAIAAMPAAVWHAPEGLGFFAAHAPITPALVTFMQAVLAFSGLLAIVGIRARAALAVFTAAGTYLFAIVELSGTTRHGMHMLWLSAILAASPCADVLAYDAPRVARTERAYELPLMFVRATLGAIYFFPGVHKLKSAGLAWALSDNLRNQMYFKWFEYDRMPIVRIDHFPKLIQVGALAVIAFELSMPLLLMIPRTRLAAAIAGLCFHGGAAVFMYLPFASLWGCYVVLFDPTRVLRWLRLRTEVTLGTDNRTVRPTMVVGSIVLAGAIVYGIRGQTNAFPFACYPTFEHLAPAAIPDLRIVDVRDDGTETIVSHARDSEGKRSQIAWGQMWSLCGATAPVRISRLCNYRRTLGLQTTQTRFERVYWSVIPEERNAPPVRALVLGTCGPSDR